MKMTKLEETIQTVLDQLMEQLSKELAVSLS